MVGNVTTTHGWPSAVSFTMLFHFPQKYTHHNMPFPLDCTGSTLSGGV
jgi:hypothetical protein